MGKTWKHMHSEAGAGRSRRSPATSAGTARPSGPTSTGSGSPASGPRSAPDPLEPFTKYLAARFVDDPHVWASALYDEVRRLGYPLSYPSFARQVRLAGLRPHCEACHGRQRPRHHRDRPSTRRRDPVGLVRATQRPVGCHGLRALGHAAALEPRCAACWPRRWTRPISSRPWTKCSGAWAEQPGCGGPTAWRP